jgi:hypothetical protein
LGIIAAINFAKTENCSGNRTNFLCGSSNSILLIGADDLVIEVSNEPSIGLQGLQENRVTVVKGAVRSVSERNL